MLTAVWAGGSVTHCFFFLLGEVRILLVVVLLVGNEEYCRLLCLRNDLCREDHRTVMYEHFAKIVGRLAARTDVKDVGLSD